MVTVIAIYHLSMALFFFNTISSSNSASDMHARLLFMAMPVQLNSRSDAAPAGRGVFSRTNRRLSSDQVDWFSQRCSADTAQVQ